MNAIKLSAIAILSTSLLSLPAFGKVRNNRVYIPDDAFVFLGKCYHRNTFVDGHMVEFKGTLCKQTIAYQDGIQKKEEAAAEAERKKNYSTWRIEGPPRWGGGNCGDSDGREGIWNGESCDFGNVAR